MRALALISIAAVAFAQTTPDPAETIRHIRENARTYLEQLALVTCTEDTRQTVKTRHLTWNETRQDDCDTRQHKLFAVQSIDTVLGDRPRQESDPEWQARLMDASPSASAPFVGALADPLVSANLQRLRTETLNGRMVDVFSWQASAADGYPLTGRNGTRRVPYRGLLFTDVASGAFVRLVAECVNIPRGSEYTGASLTLDFEREAVDGRDVVLPLRSVTRFLTDRGSTINEAQYSAYRLANFSANTEIQFGDEVAEGPLPPTP